MAKVTDDGSKVIAVDIGKLAEGMKTVFDGYAMIFSALSDQAELLSTVGKMAEMKMPEEQESEKEEVKQRTDSAPELPAAVPEKTVVSEKKEVTITRDDITKIIVAKIKVSRSNNEKIGALLQSYGCKNVSDLPTEKYEAFLSDISQL